MKMKDKDLEKRLVRGIQYTCASIGVAAAGVAAISTGRSSEYSTFGTLTTIFGGMGIATSLGVGVFTIRDFCRGRREYKRSHHETL
jgi:hypothetical protein